MKLNIKLVCVALLVAGATSGWTMEDGDGDRQEQTVASARTAKPTIDPITTSVSNIIFRMHPGSALSQKKIAFLKRYPKECKLIDHDYYDRGFNMSFLDPFFVLAMNFTEQLISRNLGRTIRVCDFGCGIGHTSILLGLLGSKEQIHVLGIENGMKADEFEETKAFHAYAERLHGQLGFVGGLPVRLKTDVEATTLQGYSTYAPSNVFDVNFMGNFLHMFAPKAAKNLVKEHAYRMLRPGGMLLASFDGICAAGNNIEKAKEVYLQAKQEGKKFPSVINILDLAIVTKYEDEIKDIEHIEEIPTIYSSAAVSEDGQTIEPCRKTIIKKCFLNVTPLGISGLQKTVCFYDSGLIELVFPKSQWSVTVYRKDIYGQYNPDLRDHEVVKWNLIAEKK